MVIYIWVYVMIGVALVQLELFYVGRWRDVEDTIRDGAGRLSDNPVGFIIFGIMGSVVMAASLLFMTAFWPVLTLISIKDGTFLKRR